MDNEQRKDLLLRQEDLEKRVSEAESSFAKIGTLLSTLASCLMNTPYKTVFANTPEPQGTNMVVAIRDPDWDDLPDWLTLLRSLRDYRDTVGELREVQSKLGHS